MMTQSHFLITALLGDRLKRRRAVHLPGLLIGSVLPDLPLILLTFGYFAYRSRYAPLQPGEPVYGPLYDNLYFHDPYWVVSTSLFHAPLIILLLATVGDYASRRERRWGSALYWFAVGCGLHCVIDILTHHSDGPLLFFPFNWHYRFSTPISYWNPAYHGRTFHSLENLLDLAILAYLVSVWVVRKWQRKSLQASSHPKSGK